jgi:PAS domain S-box-containing protein
MEQIKEEDLKMPMVTLQDHGAVARAEAASLKTNDRDHLQQELERMTALALSDPNLVLECAADGSILFANEAARSLARALGDLGLHHLLPVDLPSLLTAALASGHDIRSHESTLPQKRTIEWALRPMPLARTVFLYGTEVTARKQAEQQLHDSQERLRFALEHTQVGRWILNLRTDSACRSRHYDQIFGYDSGAPEWGYTVFLQKHVHPEDRHHVDESFKLAMAASREWEFECRIIRLDQEVRWIWARGIFAPGDDGRPRWMSGVIMDITERKRRDEVHQRPGTRIWSSSEPNLRVRGPGEAAAQAWVPGPGPNDPACEQRLHQLSESIDHSPACILIAGAAGTIEYVNRRYAQMTGYCPETLLGKNLDQLLPEGCSAELAAQVRATVTAGREWRGELHWYRKNGMPLWGAVIITPLRDQHRRVSHFVATVEDITARKAKGA